MDLTKRFRNVQNCWNMSFSFDTLCQVKLKIGKIKTLTLFTVKKIQPRSDLLPDLVRSRSTVRRGGHRKDRAKDRILAEKKDRRDRIRSRSWRSENPAFYHFIIHHSSFILMRGANFIYKSWVLKIKNSSKIFIWRDFANVGSCGIVCGLRRNEGCSGSLDVNKQQAW